MYSMTGYGRADYKDNGIEIKVEIKTVNNRNLDINSKIPRAFICYEDLIRKAIQQKVSRGRLDLFISFNDTREKDITLAIDKGLARSYFEASKTLSAELGSENDISVISLLKNPDIVKQEGITDNYDEFKEILENLVLTACDNLNAMRKIEGEKLKIDMLARVDTIKETVEKITLRAPLVAKEHAEKLKNRIEEVLKDVKYDETRLLNEVAFFSDKSNIDEELTRLNSHITQFREIVKGENVGKKLDFLIQEFNRESNTICSKANDIEVTNLALNLKCEIEKIREQVQNIE